MASLNRVFLMGNLTFDPELRRTPGGKAVSVLRLATSRTWTGNDGERREETLFIDVEVWDRQAENCCQYLRKGSSIHVEGSLKMDSWDDKNTGEKRSKIKVSAERVQFLDRRDSAGSSGSSYDDERGGPAPPREAPARRSSPPAPSAGNGASRSYGPPPSGPVPNAIPSRGRPASEPEPDFDSESPDDEDIPF